jgi:hypothetical protein
VSAGRIHRDAGAGGAGLRGYGSGARNLGLTLKDASCSGAETEAMTSIARDCASERDQQRGHAVPKDKELNAMIAAQAAANGAELLDWYTASIGRDACNPPVIR